MKKQIAIWSILSLMIVATGALWAMHAQDAKANKIDKPEIFKRVTAAIVKHQS